MKLHQDFEDVLTIFYKYGVDYMVVGGYAVNFHGYERTTSDLDIWVKPTRDNLDRIVSSLKDLGFDDESVNIIAGFDVDQPFLFHTGAKPIDVEVFNFVTGLKYVEAQPHKIRFNYSSGTDIYFISIQDLIINKMLSGRPQDKVDVEMLQRIQRL